MLIVLLFAANYLAPAITVGISFSLTGLVLGPSCIIVLLMMKGFIRDTKVAKVPLVLM